MPLSFESESHGTLAFGFFNIESDMLLLDRYFFFASDFCALVCDIANEFDGTKSEFSMQAYVIENSADIGDLHSAIAGRRYSGFIGETYKTYPFPEKDEDFKQQTKGFKTRDTFVNMIQIFGKSCELVLNLSNKKKQIKIGPYMFSIKSFSQFIQYVVEGGHPGWLRNHLPEYVSQMQFEWSKCQI